MLRIFWFIQKIENLKINFSHTKWVKTLVKIFKNGFFQKKLKIFWKMLRIFWFIQKIEKSQHQFFPIWNGSKHFFQKWIFSKTLKIVWFHQIIRNFYIQIQVNGKSKHNSMLFSGELMETGSIQNSGYWKIAGLTACYFQGNSWKLGASIIRVIGK